MIDPSVKKVFKDLENEDLPEDLDSYDKIHCDELTIGLRIYWYYEEDKKYFEDGGMDIKDYKNDIFSGIIVPIPGIETNGGGFDIENIIVCIDQYPIEKDYPEIDWVALNRLLDSKDLVEIF